MRRAAALALAFSLLLASCGEREPIAASAEPEPTLAAEPSDEPSPSESPSPSAEPEPTVDNTPEPSAEESVGEPTLRLSATDVRQGDIISVAVENAAESFDYTLYLPHSDSTADVVFLDGVGFAVAQIGVVAPTGGFTMELRCERGGESETVAAADYSIEKREYDRQDLVTSSTTQSIYTSANLSSDNEKLRAARSGSHPEPYFTGLFDCPLPEGWVLTTEFGEERYVEGNFQSRHCARDMAAPLGTAVYASSSGVVTFADELVVSGNTIVLDHGAGVSTSYSHLSEMLVEEGDFVEQGATIGRVGSTGYSTGPHLHFALVTGGYYVDPLYPQEHDLLAVLGGE